MIPVRKTKSGKTALALTGRGGLARIDIAGTTRMTPVSVRVLGKGKHGTDAVSISGVESYDGYVMVRWTSKIHLSGYSLPVEVSA